jgi:hypothetical protein
MAAKRDTSRSTYFVIGAPAANACAAHSAGGLIIRERMPSSKAWTICEHLSTPEKVLAYHLEKDPILIVHGFVLCQECNNRNILNGSEGFDRMLRSAVPKDDVFFQKFIMKEEVPDRHCYWAKLHPGTGDGDASLKHVCRHLNTSHKLNAHYASRQALFWQQDSLLCAACLEDMKNGNGEIIAKGSLKLHDNIFTKQIVGPLCLMNSEHFGLKG